MRPEAAQLVGAPAVHLITERLQIQALAGTCPHKDGKAPPLAAGVAAAMVDEDAPVHQGPPASTVFQHLYKTDTRLAKSK